MGLSSEIARLPNDHLQPKRAPAMSHSTCARMLRARGNRAACEPVLRSHNRARRRRLLLRAGTAAVEFAFVSPAFFLLVLALIELGRMVMVQQALTNAAREGCRTAVLATTIDSSKVEAAVRNYLESVISNASDDAKVRVTVPAGLASATAGTELSVAVEVDYSDVSWLPVGFPRLNPKIAAEQVGRRE
jgi:Flp pilus assembly protein TadG